MMKMMVVSGAGVCADSMDTAVLLAAVGWRWLYGFIIVPSY